MPTMTIKNIPKVLYKRLKQRAAENRRSLNSEVIVSLENPWVALRSTRSSC